MKILNEDVDYFGDFENFVSLLEADSGFEKKILDARAKFKIPKKGFKKNIDLRFKNKRSVINRLPKVIQERYKALGINDDQDYLYEIGRQFCRYYGLPDNWKFAFTEFIFSNKLSRTNDSEEIIVQGVKAFHRWFYENQENVLIIIQQKITKNRFSKWVENNWEQIEYEIRNLPKKPKSKNQVMQVYREIKKLKDQGKTAREIAEIFNSTHPHWSYDYNSINVMFNRYKSNAKKLKFKEKII